MGRRRWGGVEGEEKKGRSRRGGGSGEEEVGRSRRGGVEGEEYNRASPRNRPRVLISTHSLTYLLLRSKNATISIIFSAIISFDLVNRNIKKKLQIINFYYNFHGGKVALLEVRGIFVSSFHNTGA